MAATTLKMKTAAMEVFDKVAITPKSTTAIQIPVAFLEAIKIAEKSLGKDKGTRDVVVLSIPLERFVECFAELEEEVDAPKENTIVAKRAAGAKKGGAKKEKSPKAEAKDAASGTEEKTTTPKAKSPKAKSPKAIEEVLSEEQLEALKAKGTKPGAHLKKLASVLEEMGVPEEKHKAARDQWSAWAKSNDVPTVKVAKEATTEVLSEEQLEALKAKGYHNASQVRSMEKDLEEMGIAKENHKAARDQWVKWAKDNEVPSRKESPKASPKAKKEVKETPKKAKKEETPAAPKKVVAVATPMEEEEDEEMDETMRDLKDMLEEC